MANMDSLYNIDVRLGYAIKGKNVKEVEELLIPSLDLNRNRCLHKSAVLIASRDQGRSSITILKLLLKAGIKVDKRVEVAHSDSGFSTALHHAVKAGSLKITKILLKANASHELRNSDGYWRVSSY